MGKELYERLATVTEHISRLGSSINGSVDNYNKMVGSIERRVIPSARNFRQLNVIGDSSKELSELKQVEKEPRSLDVLNDLKQEFEDEDLKIIDTLGE